MSGTNWFDQGGANYARYRPHYPPSLAQALADLAPQAKTDGAGRAAPRWAVDVGCGNGQLTTLLAEHFDAVLGLDPSADQIAHARPHPRVHYQVASAEALHLALAQPLPQGETSPPASVALITAAQAAHWFDLPAFYGSVRLIAAPGALLALICYGRPRLADSNTAQASPLAERFDQFYNNDIGPFWPPERRLVDGNYADLPFPFEPVALPALTLSLHWPLDALLGYIATWSAVRRAREASRDDVLHRFAADMAALWGPADTLRNIVWPLGVRAGYVLR